MSLQACHLDPKFGNGRCQKRTRTIGIWLSPAGIVPSGPGPGPYTAPRPGHFTAARALALAALQSLPLVTETSFKFTAASAADPGLSLTAGKVSGILAQPLVSGEPPVTSRSSHRRLGPGAGRRAPWSGLGGRPGSRTSRRAGRAPPTGWAQTTRMPRLVLVAVKLTRSLRPAIMISHGRRTAYAQCTKHEIPSQFCCFSSLAV